MSGAYYMMHESTLIPPDRIDEINRFVSVLFVPCRQNKEAFEQCGVRIPVEVLPHGVDPEQFPLLERPKRETFTFGTFGDLTIRKGVDVLLRAFIREFQPHEPARLLIKRSWDHRELPCSVEADPRIELRSGFLEHTELLDFLRELDAFILPSRGEGFGLCGLEAMATGLPTVATNWSGPADYLDQEDSFPLDYDLVDAGGSWALGTQFFGQWAEPSVEHLQVLMRWMYEHPAESSESGCKASARVHSQWTWSRASALLRDGLDRLGADHLSDKS